MGMGAGFPLHACTSLLFTSMNTVRHINKRLVMCHNHDRHSLLPADILQQGENGFAGLIIKRAGGLITEQQLGPFGQRARNGYALLLTAG